MKSDSFAAQAMGFAALCFIPGILAGRLMAGTVPTLSAPAAALPAFAGLALRRKKELALGLMLFSAGLFSAIRGNICCPAPTPAFARECCSRLCACIDSIPFGDCRSGALVKAMLTGDRSSLDSETLGIFRKSGASHLLALSGLHLGMIYMLLSKLLLPLGMSPASRVTRSLTAVAASAFYVLVTGASPSLVRAFLFILIREASAILHRPQPPLHCLCTALLLQCVLNPAAPGDAGFRLSYLAVAGICLIHPGLSALYPSGKGPLKKMWDLASLSISCQCFTALEAWRLFRSFPAYFLITNLMALPIMTLLMPAAIATTAFAATGHCPSILVSCCEACCRMLLTVLEVVSAL